MSEKKQHLIDVQPLRTLEEIERMKEALKEVCSQRDYIMFLVGINTGLRVSDILQLKTRQILDLKKKKRKEFKVMEGKTKKERMINITAIYDEVYAYAVQNPSEWLFPSTRNGKILDKPISGIQAYRALQKAAEWEGIHSVGTHTMRKTFGYWFYKQTKDVAMLQDILNHSKPSTTLRYIGISKEEKDNVLDNFRL